MKKIIFLSFISTSLLFYACGNSEYHSYLETLSMDNVTSVSLNPNSPVLVADGVAELKFIVKASMDIENKRTIEVVVNGQNEVQDSVFSTTTLVKTDRLSVEDIVISSSRGEIVDDFTYRTTTGAGTEIEFTCTIGGKTSAPCKVKLIDKPAQYTKEIVVPVVFHILSHTSTLAACDAITNESLDKFIVRANKVFSGAQYPAAAATVDSKIKFVLATHNPQGDLMSEEGIHRHNFGDSFYEDYYFADQKPFLWDPDSYLNIYIYSSYMSHSTGPQSILASAGTLPGFPAITKVNTPSDAFYGYSDMDWGIVIHLEAIIKIGQAGNNIRFENLLGLYYGLLSTAYSSYSYADGDADYCSDTYTYRSVNMSIEKMTYVPAGSDEIPIYYNSFNIMDASGTSSAITPEQVARMRFVIENCPGRRAGW